MTLSDDRSDDDVEAIGLMNNGSCENSFGSMRVNPCKYMLPV